jgi:hypothetical protein
MVKAIFMAVAVFLSSLHVHAEESTREWFREGQWGDADKAPELWNSPLWVLKLVKDKRFDQQYRFITRLNPFYLRGDFNGDGQPDFAVLIERLSDKKQGIAVFHFGEKVIHVIAAGRKIRIGGDDFSWMDIWQVYRKGAVGRGVEEGTPPKLIGEALQIGKSESANAIIYWNGQRYAWYHQGD